MKTSPRRLETITSGQSPVSIFWKVPLNPARTRSVKAAPATRKPTRATEGTVRRAILPTIGQVANNTCTAIRAKCGAAALVELGLRDNSSGNSGHKKDREKYPDLKQSELS